MSELSKADFLNFFKYYKSEEHQIEGVSILYDLIRDVLKDESHPWIQTYRKPKPKADNNRLDVPYQSQNDNASGTGYRECFSSSCAMVAMYYGKIENDDAYNLIRQKYGDSTDAQAQVRTLRSLGLEANFVTNGSTTVISRLLFKQDVQFLWAGYTTVTLLLLVAGDITLLLLGLLTQRGL